MGVGGLAVAANVTPEVKASVFNAACDVVCTLGLTHSPRLSGGAQLLGNMPPAIEHHFRHDYQVP